MKLHHLFTINIFFAIYFGLTGSLFPQLWLVPYGLAPSDTAIWAVRLAGGSILGFATLMWYGRRHASQESRRAIALALMVQDVVGAVATFILQLQGVVNALGWSNVIGYLVLAIGYAYFLVFKPVDREKIVENN